MTDIPAQRTGSDQWRSGATPTSSTAPLSPRAAAGARLADVDQLLVPTRRYVATVLTVSLAVVFLWFGGLKLVGSSPVTPLVTRTLPWFDPDLLLPALGLVEVLLAAGLLLARARRLLLLALATHLSGTFLSFVMAPELVFQRGNPLLLTADGEFVLKNLVLISAALLLATHSPAPARA